ncbi:AI-2E family transporter [Spirillospora sp. CA-294931]|uniref:AI-2E family transporter n=1 Tax=Spirillospora sp. CA-294931 TaxID=3240042 RepID=UPI003D8DE075
MPDQPPKDDRVPEPDEGRPAPVPAPSLPADDTGGRRPPRPSVVTAAAKPPTGPSDSGAKSTTPENKNPRQADTAGGAKPREGAPGAASDDDTSSENASSGRASSGAAPSGSASGSSAPGAASDDASSEVASSGRASSGAASSGGALGGRASGEAASGGAGASDDDASAGAASGGGAVGGRASGSGASGGRASGSGASGAGAGGAPSRDVEKVSEAASARLAHEAGPPVEVGDGETRASVVAAAATPKPPAVPDPAHDVEQRRLEAGVDHGFPFGRPGEPIGRFHPFVFGFVGALGVITAWMLVRAATSAKSVLVMILVAMFLAVGLNPAVERLKRIGVPRSAAVGLVFLGVILFFAGFVASMVQPVSEQVTELRQNIPSYVQQLQDNKQISEWDKRYGLLERAQKTVNDKDFQDQLTDWATGIGQVALNGIFQTITILILTLYFLSSLPQIKTFFYRLAPRSRRARVALLGDEILDRIGGYVAGQFMIAFIAGVTSYIFLSVLGVKYALALALIVAVTDLIPLVGATIGAVVVTLVAFLNGTKEGIICAIFYLVYQQLENYLLYPRVMKRSVDVQPVVTIVAALVGAALLGVVGALLAIPTAAAISLVIREVVVPRQEAS